MSSRRHHGKHRKRQVRADSPLPRRPVPPGDAARPAWNDTRPPLAASDNGRSDALRSAVRPEAERGDRVRRHARAQFEKWAVSYDRSLLNELVFFPSIRACQEEISRWRGAGDARPFRMLDVGCGTGTLLSLMSRDPRAELLVGLDYAPEMTRRAAQKFSAAPHARKLLAVNGDAERLPFADASFDVITCCNSFHHYPHQEAVLRGFRRTLRPGGLLILIDGFRDNLIGWLVFDFAVASIERHVHHASWSEMKAMIASAGFSRLRQRKMNVFAPLLVNVAGV